MSEKNETRWIVLYTKTCDCGKCAHRPDIHVKSFPNKQEAQDFKRLVEECMWISTYDYDEYDQEQDCDIFEEVSEDEFLASVGTPFDK